MAYHYYRASIPGWGTNQLRFGAPPPVQFQPQPSWGGRDFFRAHAATADPSLYNQVYSTIANRGITSLGVSLNEARIWHQRAYGGLGTVDALSPQEIGYAAAYEAYRLWIHNSGLYEPLGGEIERQREALVGLAVAEATRLYTLARPSILHGQTPACEAAAATASLIFQENLAYGGQTYGMGMGGYPGIGGFPASPGYGGMPVVDPYTVDNEAPYFRRRAGTGRQRLLSLPGSERGSLSPAYSENGIYDRRQGSVDMYRGSPYNSGFVGTGGGMPMYGIGSPMPPAPYSPTPGVTMVPSVPGQTTVIEIPGRHHRSSGRHHRHHGHHHRRSKSIEPIITTTPGGFGPAASGAARSVGSVVGSLTGGAAGFLGGAVGGLARGAIGGLTGGASTGFGGSRAGPWSGYAGSYGGGYPASGYGYGYGYGNGYGNGAGYRYYY